MVDILQSEIKCKKIWYLIQKHCHPEHHHLVAICGMKIHWNTMYAKVLHSIDLKLVCLKIFVLI